MHKVLFYRTSSGNEVVLDLIRQLSAEEKKVVGEDLKTVQIGFPMGLPLCRPLGDGFTRSDRRCRRSVSSGSSSFSIGRDRCCWWCTRFSRRAPSCPKPIWIWRGSGRRNPDKRNIRVAAKKKNDPYEGFISLDEFLDEEGIREEVTARAIKRVIALQLQQAMAERKLSKARMAELMETSRAQLARILDPEEYNVTLDTLARAAKVLGRRLSVELN